MLYQCVSCERTFSLKNFFSNYCPHCGSGNYIKGYIDEPEKNNRKSNRLSKEIAQAIRKGKKITFLDSQGKLL